MKCHKGKQVKRYISMSLDFHECILDTYHTVKLKRNEQTGKTIHVVKIIVLTNAFRSNRVEVQNFYAS